jgi:hypothetical protein
MSECKIFHKWEYIKGDHNKYYKCSKCSKRKVEQPREGYQPVDFMWLSNNRNK